MRCQNCGGPLAPLFLSQVCAQECDLTGITLTGKDNAWAATQLRQGKAIYATACRCVTGHCGVVGLRVSETGLVETQSYLGSSWVTTPYEAEAYIYLFLGNDDITDHTWTPHPS